MTSQKADDQPAATPPCTTIYDSGNVNITVGNFTVQTSYGKGSTVTSIATSLTSQLNGSGSPVTATSSGAVITMTAVAAGTIGNYSLSYSSDGDFKVTFSGATMTGGTAGTPLAGGLNQQYTLDAWGNLSSMGLTSGLSLTPNVANQISSYTYDGAGRLMGDGHFSYTYDDDGMMISSSDGGQYYYDANGNRVAVSNSSGTKLYSYLGNTLVATYNPSTMAWTDMIYADTEIGEVGGTQTASPVYSILDHLGSEVGSVSTSTTSLDYTPFGQLLSGSNPDSFIFTGLERDGSGLDHAGARQYSSAWARWTTPDPYDGSYFLSDPRSLNRYSYVGNRPRAFTDPSGQFFGGIIASGCLPYCGIAVGLEAAGIGAVAYGVFEGIEALFDHPAFHGSLKPRANTRIWDEHGSFTPKTLGINDLLGLPKGGCEFGVCGNSFQSTGPREDAAATAYGVLVNAWWILAHTPGKGRWETNPTPRRLFGGYYCGPGGAGPDRGVGIANSLCAVHDNCFKNAGIDADGNTNWSIPWSLEQAVAASNCNQALYDGLKAHPFAVGSWSIRNWLLYGDTVGILRPGTAVNP